jgi:hypothetical protein
VKSTTIVTVQPTAPADGFVGKGHVTGNEYILGSVGGAVDIETCKTTCFSNPPCKAFAFDSRDPSCVFYSDVVSNDRFTADPESSISFYNSTS